MAVNVLIAKIDVDAVRVRAIARTMLADALSVADLVAETARPRVADVVAEAISVNSFAFSVDAVALVALAADFTEAICRTSTPATLLVAVFVVNIVLSTEADITVAANNTSRRALSVSRDAATELEADFEADTCLTLVATCAVAALRVAATAREIDVAVALAAERIDWTARTLAALIAVVAVRVMKFAIPLDVRT